MNKCKSAILLAVVTLLAGATTAMTSTKTLCAGFLPPNDMKIPVGDHSRLSPMGTFTGGVTEAEYNTIMDRIQTMYADVVKQKGGTLVINRLWSDSTVNSSAQQQGNQWIINMYGGIARHPAVTFEGEALIACHEMGHHVGGAPKLGSFGGTWATNEGGADYYATLKCLRTFFENDDNSTIVSHATIDPLARDKCTLQFKTQKEQDLCLRISMAGTSVAYVFQDLSKDKSAPKFSTPDPTQVSSTNDNHPATQCRMDTYFQGGLCTVAVSVPNSDTDFKAGSCVEGTDAIGFRPRCWFSPTSGGGGGGGGECPLGDQSLCDQLCQIQPNLPFCQK